MRWTIGGQATSIPIEDQMHAIIGFGVGHLAKISPDKKFSANINYPVYIDEPLVILHLRALLEEWQWTSRKTWLTNSLSSARNKSSIGFMFEEVVLMVLVENFGSEFTALGDVFNFCKASTLESRKVRLVSLQRDTSGVMRSCPVSWTSGSSDRIGFKAETPSDVLGFLRDPRGKTAVFPDNHCGPDLMCIFQDEKTKELLTAAFQMKIQEVLDTETWLKALESVTPEFFYTVMVHFALNSDTHLIDILFLQSDGKRSRYAPVSYPGLSEQVEVFFEQMLGPKDYKPVIDAYRKKLRSSTAAQRGLPLPKRETPTFLRIVASPDDDRVNRLAAELMPTATLKWDMVKGYIGSVADAITTKPTSVC